MPRLTLTLDSQQVSAFADCEMYYNLKFNLQLEKKELKKSLSRGLHLHNLLYLFYTGKLKKQSFDTCLNRGLRYLRMIGKKWPADDFMLMTRKFGEYCAYYRSENIQPLAVEQGFSKVLYEDPWHLFIYEGRIDFVGKFPTDRARYWVDHKSESRKEDLNQCSFQFLGYSWGLNTTNGLINYVGFQESKGPSEAFRRTIVNHSHDIIQGWKEDVIQIYFRIANAKRHGYYVKNRNTCKPYACSQCQFYELCEQTNPRKRDAIIRNDFVTRIKPWRAWE